jgi:NDP-sugar pyrophosphorylase family protein
MVRIRDHLSYTYNSISIRVIQEADIYTSLNTETKTRRDEVMLIVRADGLSFFVWEDLHAFLGSLAKGNYKIVTPKNELIGYLIMEKSVFRDLRNFHSKYESSDAGKVDLAWSILTEILEPSVQAVAFETPCFKMETVVEYYNTHFYIMRNFDDLFHRRNIPLSTGKDEENISRIGDTGFVRGSYISPSCAIDGYVESSILFPHVKIGKNAKVINSIIMGNNYIGSNAVVQNTLVCDNHEFFSKVSPNIGDGASIGKTDIRGCNELYPEYVHGGISLIGQNVEIPKGFKVSANCYIASNVDRAKLKALGELKSGDSVMPS